MRTTTSETSSVVRFDVATPSGAPLCGGLESLKAAYEYADRCNAEGWSGLTIRDSWTGRIISRA